MRVCAAVVLVLLAVNVGSAQRRPCVVPVSVGSLDLRSLPTPAAHDMETLWEKNIRTGRYELPGGRWKSAQETQELYSVLNREDPAYRLILSPVRGLKADSFIAGDKKKPIYVLSVQPDSLPRRIVFVAENGREMGAVAREFESAAIVGILSRGRPQDSFALVTSRRPRSPLGFRSTRSELRTAAKALASPLQGKTRRGGLLDALMEAIKLLQPHAPGDAVFIVGGRSLGGQSHLSFPLRLFDGKSKSRVTFKTVDAAMLAAHVRVFAIRFAPPSYPSGPTSGITCEDYNEGFGCFNDFGTLKRDPISRLVIATNGGTVVENIKTNHRLTTARLSAIAQHAEELYLWLTGGYLVQLNSTEPGTFITLSASARAKVPWFTVLPADGKTRFECLH